MLESKPGSMSIIDISPEGMKILTLFDISVMKNVDVDVDINFTLNDERIYLKGKFIWKKKELGQYLYGLRMETSTEEKQHLIQQLKFFVKRNINKSS